MRGKPKPNLTQPKISIKSRKKNKNKKKGGGVSVLHEHGIQPKVL